MFGVRSGANKSVKNRKINKKHGAGNMTMATHKFTASFN